MLLVLNTTINETIHKYIYLLNQNPNKAENPTKHTKPKYIPI